MDTGHAIMAENVLPPLSTSKASTKSKRHSLNITSPGPRPLHLASGSVLSSPSASTSRYPVLHNFGADSPVLPLSPVGITNVKNGRRQSSISYIPSNRDKDRPTSLLSPLASAGFPRHLASRNGNPTSAGSPGIELDIEHSSKVAIDTASAVTLDASKLLKRRPPTTLAEKHEELLHFIAQKESKCLELRSQLATHEAELLQLKRKWERIVNRGFEKTSSTSFPSPSIPSTAPSYIHPSPVTVNAPSNSGGVVLEGIKEGVQGMGRFITAGLGIAHVGIGEGNTSTSPIGTLSPTPSGSRQHYSKFPVPLRLGAGNNYNHESQSSSSTSASVTTGISSSSTSATSFMLENDTTQILLPPLTSVSDQTSNEYNEFGDFEEAPTRHLDELAEQEENLEQVLMVHDTGATPTMSPNPHFQRRGGRMKVEQKDSACDVSELNPGWDDVWATSGALVDNIDDFTNTGSQVQTPSSFHTIQPVPTKPPKIKTPSLPGVSSIPGLASSSMPMNGTTPQLMSSWVGSMGKKWGEIRESETFTKSQKRASIIFSDVSQSIVSALISPSPLAPHSRPVMGSSFATNACTHLSSPSPLIKTKSSITMNKSKVPISASLLDDLDIGEIDGALKLGIGSPVLMPNPVLKDHSGPSTKNVPGVLSSNSSDDEDWNW